MSCFFNLPLLYVPIPASDVTITVQTHWQTGWRSQRIVLLVGSTVAMAILKRQHNVNYRRAGGRKGKLPARCVHPGPTSKSLMKTRLCHTMPYIRAAVAAMQFVSFSCRVLSFETLTMFFYSINAGCLKRLRPQICETASWSPLS